MKLLSLIVIYISIFSSGKIWCQKDSIDCSKNYCIPENTTRYNFVTISPTPLEGWKDLLSKVRYPKEALQRNIEGKLKVKATIDTNGNAVCVSILGDTLGYGCEEEAIRLISEAKYRPCEFLGKKFPLTLWAPVEFKIDCQQKYLNEHKELSYPPAIMPKLIGGWDSLYLKLKYPPEAIKNNIEGKVNVWAIIDTYGKASCLSIMEAKGHLGFGCEEEAMRLIREAAFTPCEIKDVNTNSMKKIEMAMVFQIEFNIKREGQKYEE